MTWNKYIIDAEDVKLIRVADAAIFPDSGYVRILRGGQIERLKMQRSLPIRPSVTT